MTLIIRYSQGLLNVRHFRYFGDNKDLYKVNSAVAFPLCDMIQGYNEEIYDKMSIVRIRKEPSMW